MHCTHCGSKIELTFEYCSNCGYKIPNETKLAQNNNINKPEVSFEPSAQPQIPNLGNIDTNNGSPTSKDLFKAAGYWFISLGGTLIMVSCGGMTEGVPETGCLPAFFLPPFIILLVVGLIAFKIFRGSFTASYVTIIAISILLSFGMRLSQMTAFQNQNRTIQSK
jgi:hypothetical protein